MVVGCSGVLATSEESEEVERLAGICVKLRHKPVNKPAQLIFPIRLFSGGGDEEEKEKRP